MRKELLKYISEKILPIYDELPEDHSRDYVDRITKEVLKTGKRYHLNEEMSMVIAAYHDVGLAEGADDHEYRSAMRLKGDRMLGTWFAFEEIETMWRAVEDHHSSSRKPRSIYGKAIHEAIESVNRHF